MRAERDGDGRWAMGDGEECKCRFYDDERGESVGNVVADVP
jgi:hypothetical protein